MNEVEVPEAVLVIAWGNPLREDDGVAWHVVERLRRLQPRPSLPSLRVRHAHQLTPELAEPVSHALGVVFVDARRDGTPGEVRCEAVSASPGRNPLAHSLSPEALLLYAEGLYGRAPAAVVVSIAGERFGMGDELSPIVRAAVPAAVRAIFKQARIWMPAPQPEPHGEGR